MANAIAGGPQGDPRCEGLSGAAYGLCSAAVAIGCDDTTISDSGCNKIGENFIQVTGSPPPWECQLTVDPTDQLYDLFEGIYLDNSCLTDDDCVASGTYGADFDFEYVEYVCAAEATLTPIVWNGPIPAGDCFCVGGTCSWAIFD